MRRCAWHLVAACLVVWLGGCGSGTGSTKAAGPTATEQLPALTETPLWNQPLGAQPDGGEVDTAEQRALDGLPAYAGTIYYVSSAKGLDTYNGLSRYPGKMDDNATVNAAYGPWKTLTPVRSKLGNSGFALAGSAFLMERGSVFDGFIAVQVGAPHGYTFGAYGTGARPQIRPGGLDTTWLAAIWSNGRGVYIRNLDLFGDYAANASDSTHQLTGGIYMNPGATFLEVVNCTIRDFGSMGIEVGGAVADHGLVQNSLILNTRKSIGAGQAGAGISGDISRTKILGCTIDGNGVHKVLAHGIYAGGEGAWVQGCLLRNNSNLGWVEHGVTGNMRIADSEIYNNGNGVMFSWANYGTYEALSNVLIERCYIHDNGTNGQGFGVTLNTTINGVIRNNVFQGNPLADIIINDANNANVAATAGIRIFNNTAYKTTAGQNILVGGVRTTDVVAKNNILYRTSTSGACLELSPELSATQLTVDGNAYYAPNLPSGAVVRWNTGGVATNYTLTAFKSGALQEAAGIYADPLFTNATAFDFTLQANSPVKSKGLPLGITFDKKGVLRSTTTPSIGAYE
jgi:hypothetical protein